MNRRRVMLELGWLLLVVMLVGFLWLKRQTGPGPASGFTRTMPPTRTPPPVDLTRHDGQTVDFSSGKPVVKATPADQAALDQAIKAMDEAAKTVTFAPLAATADRKPAAPPKP